MAWHLPAAVVVAVVFRDVVHIMEDQAVPVQVLHGLQETHVEEHGSVEGLAPALDNTGAHKAAGFQKSTMPAQLFQSGMLPAR